MMKMLSLRAVLAAAGKTSLPHFFPCTKLWRTPLLEPTNSFQRNPNPGTSLIPSHHHTQAPLFS